MQHSLLNNPSRRIKVALATAPTVTTSLKAALLAFNGSFRAPTSFGKAGKLRCFLLEKVKLVAEGQHQRYNSKMMEEISAWESYDVVLEKTLLPKYCLQPMRSFRSALPWGTHRFPWNLAGGTWDRGRTAKPNSKDASRKHKLGLVSLLMQKKFPPTDAGHSTHPRKKTSRRCILLILPSALSPLRNLSSHDESLFIFVG